MFALIKSISALIYYFSNFHGQILIKPWIGKYTIQLHVSGLIKLDVLIIRWIRFDRILFSDIIILRILWSVSSLRHVYDHSGILEEDLCVRSTSKHVLDFILTIYLCWSTCNTVCIYNKCQTTLFLSFYQKTEGNKYGNVLPCRFQMF